MRSSSEKRQIEYWAWIVRNNKNGVECHKMWGIQEFSFKACISFKDVLLCELEDSKFLSASLIPSKIALIAIIAF